LPPEPAVQGADVVQVTTRTRHRSCRHPRFVDDQRSSPTDPPRHCRCRTGGDRAIVVKLAVTCPVPARYAVRPRLPAHAHEHVLQRRAAPKVEPRHGVPVKPCAKRRARRVRPTGAGARRGPRPGLDQLERRALSVGAGPKVALCSNCSRRRRARLDVRTSLTIRPSRQRQVEAHRRPVVDAAQRKAGPRHLAITRSSVPSPSGS